MQLVHKAPPFGAYFNFIKIKQLSYTKIINEDLSSNLMDKIYEYEDKIE
jgi:hypothetical protein